MCDLGFHMAGYSHTFFCEVDPFCRSILSRHWPEVPIFEDVKSMNASTIPDVDVLVGGFPCQDVSCGGKRAGISTETRSGLWYEYKRIIVAKRPKYAVIENVKGLLSKGMEDVLQDLSDIGYDAEWQCLPASTFGAPHLRERIFIVAYPHSDALNENGRIFTTNSGNLEYGYQLGNQSDWLGIRIDRTRKKAIRDAYSGTVLCRVDDGRSVGVDESGRKEPGLCSVPYITKETY